MDVQKFMGANLKEALQKVKKILGPEAVILNTRHVHKGGILGWGGNSWVEIEATSQKEDLPSSANSLHDIESEMRKLRKEVASFIRGNEKQGPSDPLHQKLLQKGLSSSLAQNLVEESRRFIQSSATLSERYLVVRDLLARKIQVRGDLELSPKPHICALIGPTGVGKTTTIAKMVARFNLEEQKSVGLFTLDTYRIGAVEQLQTYSDIIEVPLKVIRSVEEVAQAKKEFDQRDIILVDTAGRNQKDAPKMKNLKGFLEALQADEVHLVISATTGKEGVENIIHHFEPCGITHVILTKIDEASTFGHLISIVLEKGYCLSFLGIGQEVPADLRIAQGEMVASLIAGTGTGV